MSSMIKFVVPYTLVNEIKPHVTLTGSFELRLRLDMPERFVEFDVSNVHVGSMGMLPKSVRLENSELFFQTYVFVAEFTGLYGSVKRIAEGLTRLGIPFYTDADDSDSHSYFKQSSVKQNLELEGDRVLCIEESYAYSFHNKETFDQEVNPDHWQYVEVDDE